MLYITKDALDETITVPYKIMPRAKTMTCSCCGIKTKGRQHYNRDTGYALCTDCIPFVAERESPEEMEENYGYKGYHYNPVDRVTIDI